MPILVKIYNKIGKIIAVNIYYNMDLAIRHSKNLISYYDLRKTSGKYTTYKKYLKVEKLTITNFLFLLKILCLYDNNNACLHN